MEPQISPAEQLPLLPSFCPTHVSYSEPTGPSTRPSAPSPSGTSPSGLPESESSLVAGRVSSSSVLLVQASARIAATSGTQPAGAQRGGKNTAVANGETRICLVMT